ncbi:MAG: hypothetical protein KGJ41_08265 [Rhodospirillales bacterium]|nr:hypothetical protein [Rhodospirillales bacterium]
MATNVTVLGGGGTTVTIPFTSAGNAAAAQSALSVLNPAIAGGIETVYQVVAGSQTVPVPGLLGMVVDTLNGAGSAASLGVVSSPNNALVDAGSAPLVAAIAGGGNWTVASGNNSSLAIMNAALGSQPTKVFFGGGFNAFSEAPYVDFASASAVVNVDGSSTVAANTMNGGAVIVAPYGATTVNVFSNAIVDIVSVGSSASVVVNAESVAGTPVFEAVQVDGGSSSAGVVTVNGAAGVNLTYIATSGPGFINPNGSDVTINGGVGAGSVTVAAGVTSLYAVNATGLLRGGSAGGNNIQSSTVAGVATLFGGGGNDKLELDGARQIAFAGNGANVIVSGQSASGADTITAGLGSGTLQGGLAGGNTINFGAGTYTLFGMHGAGITASNADIYNNLVGGGQYTIEDFYSQQFGGAGFDKVLLGTAAVSSVTTVAGTGGYSSAVATLSDGTKITFQNLGGVVQNHGSYLS